MAAQGTEHVITIEVNSGDFVGPLALFLARVGVVAAGGHSFDIEADRADGEGFKIGIDGDGADRIIRVLLDGKVVKPEQSRSDSKMDACAARTDALSGRLGFLEAQGAADRVEKRR